MTDRTNNETLTAMLAHDWHDADIAIDFVRYNDGSVVRAVTNIELLDEALGYGEA